SVAPYSGRTSALAMMVTSVPGGRVARKVLIAATFPRRSGSAIRTTRGSRAESVRTISSVRSRQALDTTVICSIGTPDGRDARSISTSGPTVRSSLQAVTPATTRIRGSLRRGWHRSSSRVDAQNRQEGKEIEDGGQADQGAVPEQKRRVLEHSAQHSAEEVERVALGSLARVAEERREEH